MVLGAGASYDSVSPLSWSSEMAAGQRDYGVPNYQPPLANDIFDNRPNFREVLLRFQECAALVAKLRRLRNTDGFLLEAELRKRQDRAEELQYAPYFQELIAVRFYLQHVLWECGTRWHSEAGGATNYAELVAVLARWRHESASDVSVVTFNYDTMLEAATEQHLGVRYDSLSSYVANPEFQIVKLHGSANWTRPVPMPTETPNYVDGDQARRVLIKKAPSYNLGSYEIRNPHDPPQVTTPGREAIHLPALAIPMQRKDQFECPGNHVDALAPAIWNARRLLIVGWSATELDFIDMLKKLREDCRVLVVNGPSPGGDEAVGRLQEGEVPLGNVEVFPGGFSEVVGSDVLERFLRL